MTSPATPEATATVDESALLNDDALLSAAIAGRVERNQHVIPDEPAPDATAPETPAATTATPPDPAKATEAAPDSTKPDATTDAPADQPDPFAVLAKDAKPLGYRVNQTDRLFEAIREIPGKGAIIPPDKVDEVRNMVARYESNADAVKQLLPKVQQYDALGGVEKFHEVNERNAQLNAASLHIINTVFENPRQFVNDDGTPNTVALQMLRREAAVIAQEAQWKVRAERTTAEQTSAVSQREAEVRSTAVPQQLAQHYPDLHADDRALMERHADSYLFAVTPEQAPHYGVPVGTLMVNMDALKADAEHLKGLRGAKVQTETAAQLAVKAAEKAAAENAKRNPPPAPKPKAPTLPRDPDTGQWKRAKRLDAAEIFERSMRGDPIGAPQLTE